MKSAKHLPLRDRVWRKVEKTPGCWYWRGNIVNGYGRIGVGKFTAHVHRLTYEWEYGKIPQGLMIDHLCETKECVRPSHLEAVTNGENNRRKRYRPQHVEQLVLWGPEPEGQLSLWHGSFIPQGRRRVKEVTIT